MSNVDVLLVFIIIILLILIIWSRLMGQTVLDTVVEIKNIFLAIFTGGKE